MSAPDDITDDDFPGEPGNDGEEPDHEPDAETDPHTDLANSERLVRRFGPDLRHVAKWSTWLHYDGRRFVRLDGTGPVARKAKIVVREMFAEAQKRALAATAAVTRAEPGSEQEDRAKAALKRAMAAVAWAKSSQSKNRIDAMIALAASADEIAISHDDLDAHPHLFNVANGTLDTRTGELQPHRRDDLITKIALVVYDPSAEAPVWAAFLLVVVPDAEVRTLLQRFAGCCLTGDTSDRVFLFLFGSGRNGKSVFLRVLRTLLGEYGIVAAPDLLLKKKGEAHPTELADMFGARLTVCQEVPKNRTFDEQRIKEITGNEGQLKARRMHEDFWHFRPETKLAIAGNAQPRVNDDTDAIWDRMRLAPFTTRITDEQLDKHLFEKLEKELPGILAWAVRGCADWRKHGLPAPKAVADATQAYRAAEDTIGRFLSDCCVIHASRKATTKSLTDAARAWSTGNGERDVSQKDLVDRLRREGCSPGSVNRARGWFGIGLLTPEEERSREAEKEGTSEGSATAATPATANGPYFTQREIASLVGNHQPIRVAGVASVATEPGADDGEPFYEPDYQGAFDDLLRGDS